MHKMFNMNWTQEKFTRNIDSIITCQLYEISDFILYEKLH